HLRFDDTNPIEEEQEYIDSIQEDIRWLGFDWGEHLYFASDYFHQLYDWAVHLIKAGKAYVDDLSADKIREHPGTLTHPRKPPPPSRPTTAPRATVRSMRTSPGSSACARGSFRTAPECSGQRSTWPRPTSTCATRCSIGSCTQPTRGPATSGASIRCTTSPTASRTQSRASPTPFARSSSRITDRSTTG